MTGSKLNKQRRYPRVELEYEVLIQAAGEDFWVTALNLSFGGAFVETEAPLKGGMRVTLTLNHLDVYGSCEADVVWCTETGYGLQFINKGTEFSNALLAIITPLLDQTEADRSE